MGNWGYNSYKIPISGVIYNSIYNWIRGGPDLLNLHKKPTGETEWAGPKANWFKLGKRRHKVASREPWILGAILSMVVSGSPKRR